MTISIIIPTFNESGNIGSLLNYLRKNGGPDVSEIIVSDGGSTDETMTFARKRGAITVLSPQKGRAAQMNYGASLATGDILYFIHADVIPPASFPQDILLAADKGFEMGRYTMKFITRKWYLRFNEFFSRFDWYICYGGDQTLFIKRTLFETVGGFNMDMRIMEDFEFTKRMREKKVRYKIFQKGALVSDRKYNKNSWWQVQKANYTIIKMYKMGASQEAMVNKYKAMLNYR